MLLHEALAALKDVSLGGSADPETRKRAANEVLGFLQQATRSLRVGSTFATEDQRADAVASTLKKLISMRRPRVAPPATEEEAAKYLRRACRNNFSALLRPAAPPRPPPPPPPPPSWPPPSIERTVALVEDVVAPSLARLAGGGDVGESVRASLCAAFDEMRRVRSGETTLREVIEAEMRAAAPHRPIDPAEFERRRWARHAQHSRARRRVLEWLLRPVGRAKLDENDAVAVRELVRHLCNDVRRGPRAASRGGAGTTAVIALPEEPVRPLDPSTQRGDQ